VLYLYIAQLARMTEQMNKEEFSELARKISDGTATDAEISRYNTWFNTYAQNESGEWNESESGKKTEKEEQLFQSILQRIQPKQARIVPLIYKITAAASIILGIAAASIYFIQKQHAPTQQTANLIKNDIAPGHNQATLTLANGQKIILTKGLSGQIAVQNSTTINANRNTITYNANTNTKNNSNTDTQADQNLYNTLSTARGEQSPYPLVLADGTKVWLNAESSITFPTAFNGKERIVKLTGEAYFEVKHNGKQPFKVQTQKQTIEDIGTSFDVNAYTDEPNTKTTLIEGSVKVNNLTLKPGQQTDGIHTKTVNTEIYTAWKEGNFHFEGEDIKTIMRQLSRWYNIEVVYEGNITKEKLYADISRNRNISAALKVLQNSQGVRFKVEGRRVTVIE
jgi:hypothetical protein